MNTLGNISAILSFFLGMFIMLSLVLIYLLLKNSTMRRAGIFVILLLSVLMLHLTTYLLFLTKIIYKTPHLLGASYPLLFLMGPLYYYFLRLYFEDEYRLRFLEGLHLIPFLTIVWYSMPMYIATMETKLKIIDYLYHRIPEGTTSFYKMLSDNLFMILLCFYGIFSLRYMWHIRKEAHVRTLYRLTVYIFIFSIIFTVVQVGLFFTGKDLITSEISLFLLLCLLIFRVTVYFLDLLFIAKPSKKYKTSSLSEVEMQEIELALLEVLEREKIFKEPGIDMTSLAMKVNIPKHHISQTLSEHMQQSFYELINRYRVIEVKKMLKEGYAKRISIQAIGEECGFSNKTSFYRAFRKFENTTPHNYLTQYI